MNILANKKKLKINKKRAFFYDFNQILKVSDIYKLRSKILGQCFFFKDFKPVMGHY